MEYRKKLIEVALPLEKINAESAREKSIRKGHPSTLHLWWARRPLAAARAVIWASLIDDPSSHPELYPTEELQTKERQRLFKILENLVVWENSSNTEVINQAIDEIKKTFPEAIPTLLDPFAGGGAIPLEAQRLGLTVYAHDLNPIAVTINKSMIEIPCLFSSISPVNPTTNESLLNDCRWEGTSGMAEDIRYYGEWIKREAHKRIGYLYPKVHLSRDNGNAYVNAVAWIWARTVKCPNPACGCQMPLISSYVLSKKKGHEAWVKPTYKDDHFEFEVNYGRYPIEYEAGSKLLNEKSKGQKGTFCCPLCHQGIVKSSYIDNEANEGRMGVIPVAIVAEGNKHREYLTINHTEMEQTLREIDDYYSAMQIDDFVPHEHTRGTFASNAQGGYYGFLEFKDYFSKRQRIALTTFSQLIGDVQSVIEQDAITKGMKNDHVSLSSNGTGAKAYSQALAVYFTFVLDRMVDKYSSVCVWNNIGEKIEHTFGRQAIPMAWDYAEANPFSNSSGCYTNMLGFVTDYLDIALSPKARGVAEQYDAQIDCGLRNIIISTDPPYYDNICYSDLSDFFYVWMRKCLKDIYPDLFETVLVPKAEELIATPYRHNGSKQEAKSFFENGMLRTCQQLYQYAHDDIPVTIYYAYKQSDNEDEKTSSSGWETMLSAIIQAGFKITGTWPVNTERQGRLVGNGANALASSIVLVCRKRSVDAPQTTKKNLVNALRRELRPALKKLQDSNIAPVDLAQSAIGPGMGVFSQYRRVLEADGSPMSVRSALQIINEEIDLFFNEQVGSLDTASRFCVDLYTQSAYNDIKYGAAEVLANAKGTSIPMMASHGVLYAKAGIVHLIERTDLPEKIDVREDNIWMLTQQLTQAMAKGGVEACAQAVVDMFGSNAEFAKDLAYRLYTIAERKGWANEAFAYNSLVVAWPDIQTRAAELKQIKPEQISLFDIVE